MFTSAFTITLTLTLTIRVRFPQTLPSHTVRIVLLTLVLHLPDIVLIVYAPISNFVFQSFYLLVEIGYDRSSDCVSGRYHDDTYQLRFTVLQNTKGIANSDFTRRVKTIVCAWQRNRSRTRDYKRCTRNGFGASFSYVLYKCVLCYVR